MLPVNLTIKQLIAITAAMQAVSPVGGGSFENTLACNLRKLLGDAVTDNDLLNQTVSYCMTVVDNAVDANIAVRV
jgi:hypothetical protein